MDLRPRLGDQQMQRRNPLPSSSGVPLEAEFALRIAVGSHPLPPEVVVKTGGSHPQLFGETLSA